LLNRMHDLSTTIASGNRTDAGHKVADLIHDLANLAHGGQLTAAGQRILAAPLAALERAIQAARIVHALRSLDLQEPPSISESADWPAASCWVWLILTQVSSAARSRY